MIMFLCKFSFFYRLSDEDSDWVNSISPQCCIGKQVFIHKVNRLLIRFGLWYPINTLSKYCKNWTKKIVLIFCQYIRFLIIYIIYVNQSMVSICMRKRMCICKWIRVYLNHHHQNTIYVSLYICLDVYMLCVFFVLPGQIASGQHIHQVRMCAIHFLCSTHRHWLAQSPRTQKCVTVKRSSLFRCWQWLHHHTATTFWHVCLCVCVCILHQR